MKIIIKDTYEELSELTTSMLLAEMSQDKRVNLSITAGNSPKGVYELLAPKMKAAKDDYSHVHFYNFDEVPAKDGGVGMTLGALNEQIFNPADVNPENVHGMSEENYQALPDTLASVGGLDMMLIGIGADGHFCANMPGTTKFDALSYKVDLTKDVDAPWYQGMKAAEGDNFPDCFYTLGAASLMRVKHLVMIANGSSKAGIIERVVNGEVDVNVPSSILKLHPNFTLILDKEAAAKLK